MDRYKKVSIDDIWVAPDEKVRTINPSGCDFIDVLSLRVLNEKHIPATAWAKRMGVTPEQFYVLVKALTGKTAWEWISELKVRLITHWLLRTLWPIKEIARLAGFSSSNAMLKFYLSHTGQTPRQFRDENQRVIVQTTKTIVEN